MRSRLGSWLARCRPPPTARCGAPTSHASSVLDARVGLGQAHLVGPDALISVPRQHDPGLEGVLDVNSWRARRLTGQGRRGPRYLRCSWPHGLRRGDAQLAGPGRTNAGPLRTGVRLLTDHPAGIAASRRSPPRWCRRLTVDHCTSPPFVPHRPYPIQRAAQASFVAVRHAPFAARRRVPHAGRRSSCRESAGVEHRVRRPGSSRAASVDDRDVRLDADVVDPVLVGGQPLGDREPEATAVALELGPLLDRALAVGRRRRPASPRPRSWSAPATISEADADPPSTRTTSSIAGSVAAPPGFASVSIRCPVGVLLPEDRAVGEELAGDVAGRVDEAARVAAQVEDELRLPGVDVGPDGLVELVRGVRPRSPTA